MRFHVRRFLALHGLARNRPQGRTGRRRTARTNARLGPRRIEAPSGIRASAPPGQALHLVHRLHEGGQGAQGGMVLLAAGQRGNPGVPQHPRIRKVIVRPPAVSCGKAQHGTDPAQHLARRGGSETSIPPRPPFSTAARSTAATGMSPSVGKAWLASDASHNAAVRALFQPGACALMQASATALKVRALASVASVWAAFGSRRLRRPLA